MKQFTNLIKEIERQGKQQNKINNTMKKTFKKLNVELKKDETKSIKRKMKEMTKSFSNSITKYGKIADAQNNKIAELQKQVQENKQYFNKPIQMQTLDIQIYMMKNQNKKRTGKHRGMKYDSEGNEYIESFSFPYVSIQKHKADKLNINEFYNVQDDGVPLMKAIEQIILNSDEDNANVMNHYLLSEQVDAFMITSKTNINNVQPQNVLKTKLKNEGNNSLKINCKYTQYKLNLEAKDFKDLLQLEHIPYIKQNYRPYSCVLTALINAFYNRFEVVKMDGKRMYKELTYSNLCNILEIPDKPDNNEIDIETAVEKFIKKYKFLSIYVYDPYMNCILSHQAIDAKHSSSIRVMIKNNHLYQLNSNLKSLQNKPNYEDDERQEIKVSNKYYIKEEKKQEINETKDEPLESLRIFSDNLKDIFDKIVQYSKLDTFSSLRIITNENMNNILLHCVSCSYEPKVYFNTFLFKILIYVNDKPIYIETGDNNPTYGSRISFNSVNEYQQFDESYNKISKDIIKTEYISEFHPQVQEIDHTYKITPLVSSFKDADLNKLYDTIDENKAYTECLMNINTIPIFHYFDVYKPYDNHTIEELTYYLIEVLKDTEATKILFGSKYSRTYGFVLKQLQNIKDVKIHYYRKPIKIEEVDFKTPVKELYERDIPIEFKKMIINKLTGMLELKYNKNHLSKIFEDQTEAECYKLKYSGKIIPITKHYYTESEEFEPLDNEYIKQIKTNSETPYFLVNVFNKKNLCNGLYPIKDIIYLKQRCKLLNLYIKLKEQKINVYGFKTDCVFIDKNLPSKILKNINVQFDSKIGHHKYETNKYLPSAELSLELNELIDIQDLTKPEIQMFKDERNKETMNKYLVSKSNVLIKGEYPGVGKSTLCKNYDENALFILPYNKLCQNIKQEGFQAITYSKAFGLYANDIELKTLKEMDLSDYKTVVFDECLLYTPDRLKRLDILIRKYPNIKFMATGDTDQRNPVGFDNSDYLNHCMNIIFPNQILLSEIKRLANNKDKEIWKLLKHDILKTNLSIEDICKKHSIKTINKIEDITTKRNICYFNFRCLEVNEHIHKNILKNTEKYFKGLEIICRKYEKTKEYVLNTNYTYKIKSMKPKIVIVDEVDQKEYTIPQRMLYSHFKLPYSLTCDSVQGLSFGEQEKITILDSNIPYTDRKYFYTSITRSRKVENVTIFIHPEAEQKRFSKSRVLQYFRFKVENYKQQDFKAKREYKQNEFITAEQIDDLLTRQNNKCLYCNCHFDIDIDINSNVVSNITVDRINNKFAHTKSNSVLACVACNCSRKNNYNNTI